MKLKTQLQEVQLENRKLRDEAQLLTQRATEVAAAAQSEALKQKQIADRATAELQKFKSK